MLPRFTCVCLVVLSLAGVARAQEFQPRKYDGIQAGVDAYQLAEERRQANLQAQIGANDAARAAAGLPTTRGETVYYYNGYSPYGVAPWDAAYAYGGTFGYATTGRFGRRVAVVSTGPVFSPWPYVPGDIYGYRTYPQVRQPIGQRQVQIDENTWESHPVYDPPVPQRRVLPPVDSPLLDNTPFATPRVEPAVVEPAGVDPELVEPIPAGRPASTAREF
jgi:hypothetical protein